MQNVLACDIDPVTECGNRVIAFFGHWVCIVITSVRFLWDQFATPCNCPVLKKQRLILQDDVHLANMCAHGQARVNLTRSGGDAWGDEPAEVAWRGFRSPFFQ